MNWQNLVFVFSFAFHRLDLSHAFNFNAYSSNCTSEVSCSLSSCSLFKFVTDLFKPWEIVYHVWELSLFTDEILISTQYLPCKQQVVNNFQYGVNLSVSSDPTFWFRWIFVSWQNALTTENWICELCNLFSVFRHEYCPTWTVKNRASIQNLLNLSCWDIFQFVLRTFKKEILDVQDHHHSKTCSSWSHRVQNEELDCLLTTGLHPFYRDKIHILHTFLRLLREDWADLQK